MNTAVRNRPNHLELIANLSKLPTDHLDAYIEEICASRTLNNCSASIHFKYLLSDGNGIPRVEDLARKLALHIIDFAIPRSKRDEANDYQRKYNSSAKWIELHHQARNLFTDLANTGEGGETLLYLLAETYLKFPQVSCKMPLKTNPRMHVHGSDGLHAKFDETKKKLALYWCESKLYSDTSKAMGECFNSIAPFLISTGGSNSSQERDLQLIRDHLDLMDEKLESAFLSYLNPDSKDFNSLEYRGICLIGFDSDHYPTLDNKKENDDLKKVLESEVEKWCKSFEYHIGKHKLSHTEIEIFCLPFPSVELFRQAFLKELGN